MRWEPYGEAGSPALNAVHLNRSVMKIHHQLHQMQSDTCAPNAGSIAAAVIALEDPRLVTNGNTHSVILHRYDNLIRFETRAELDQAAFGRILDRVGQEVSEHLRKQVHVPE